MLSSRYTWARGFPFTRKLDGSTFMKFRNYFWLEFWNSLYWTWKQVITALAVFYINLTVGKMERNHPSISSIEDNGWQKRLWNVVWDWDCGMKLGLWYEIIIVVWDWDFGIILGLWYEIGIMVWDLDCGMRLALWYEIVIVVWDWDCCMRLGWLYKIGIGL